MSSMNNRYAKTTTSRRERTRSSDQYDDKLPALAKSPYVRHQKHRPALGDWVED
jgi:hypothetical protein